MKLRSLLSVLHPETVVCLVEDDKLDLVVKVKDIPKELKERTVKKLNTVYIQNQYDLSISLKV